MFNFFTKNSTPKKPERIYLDYAATTPMDPEVKEALVTTLDLFYANPGGPHAQGRAAKEMLAAARARVASVVGMQPTDIVFTRGGTESDVLGLWGIIEAYRDDVEGLPHVIISTIEHSAVRESAHAWEAQGKITLTELGVDANGIVSPDELKSAITPQTVLVSVMYVNNETGSVEPIRELAKTIRWYRKHNQTQFPYFHTDAIQAPSYLDIFMPRLGVDLMSFSSSKIYGPKWMGVLVTKPELTLVPLMHGGHHEFDLRPGTEDVAGCVAFALALEKAVQERDIETARLAEIKRVFLEKLAETSIDYRIHGATEHTSPHIINIGIKGTTGERLIIELDAKGFAVLSRSACATNEAGESHVLASMGYHTADGYGAIRISTGKYTTHEHLAKIIGALEEVMEKIHKENEIVGA